MLSLINQIGFYLLLLLLTIIPFHFWASDFGIFALYREMIAIIFFILLVTNMFYHRHISTKIRIELFFLILFPFLLIISAAYDPMIILYDDGTSVANITNDLVNIDPRIYVLRNALLYLPMILYFSIRGITDKEIQKIAIISIAAAPFSILFYLLNIFETSAFSVFLLGEMGEMVGPGIEYNSYVPYLSFPVISGIYLLSGKHSLILKLATLAAVTITTIFIFLSSSRQTLLFVVLTLFFFLTLDRSKRRTTQIILFSIVTLFVFQAYEYIMSDYNLDSGLMQKYTGGENYRFEKIIDGLMRLDPLHYLTGAGLTSVIVSGPHNDYVRWTQRVGLIIMTIGFIPYFTAAYHCFIGTLRDRKDLVNCYIGLAIFFIIYHSVFGYPRADAYQAVWAYLGVTMWLGYTKSKQENTLYQDV